MSVWKWTLLEQYSILSCLYCRVVAAALVVLLSSSLSLSQRMLLLLLLVLFFFFFILFCSSFLCCCGCCCCCCRCCCIYGCEMSDWAKPLPFQCNLFSDLHLPFGKGASCMAYGLPLLCQMIHDIFVWDHDASPVVAIALLLWAVLSEAGKRQSGICWQTDTSNKGAMGMGQAIVFLRLLPWLCCYFFAGASLWHFAYAEAWLHDPGAPKSCLNIPKALHVAASHNFDI